MGKRVPYTPVSVIKNYCRNLFMRSRERASAIKRTTNTCERCGRKGSVAKGREVKIRVHHVNGIKWDRIIQVLREELLQGPYEVLCKECHDLHHTKETNDRA
jgi:hypothetical protein